MSRTYNQAEKRTFKNKWNSIAEARVGLSGSADVVERQAQARMKAQKLFKDIRAGKVQ